MFSKRTNSKLLHKLRQLATSENITDFQIDPCEFPPKEQEMAALLQQALQQTRRVAEYEFMKYRLTNDALGIAHWDMDVIKGDPVNPHNPFTWSQEFRHMIGFSDESDFPNLLSSWANRLHPADKDRVLHDFEAHITDATGQTPYNLEYRLMTKDGEYRNFRAIGLTLRDDSGTPRKVAGALMDITDSLQQQEMLENILNTMDSYIYVSDMETDEMLFVNRKMMNDYGLEEGYKGQLCWRRLQDNQNSRCHWCKKGELSQNPGKAVAWEQHSAISGNDLFKIDRVIDWPGGRRVHMQQNIDVTDIKRAHEDILQRKKTMDTINQAAKILLSQADEMFEQAMTKGIHLISDIVHFDRMSIFRNQKRRDGMHLSQVYRWARQSGGTTRTLDELADITYGECFPGWEEILAAGDCINSPVRLMPNKEIFKRYGSLSVLVVPVHNRGIFWGFVLFEHLREETLFSELDVNSLRSVSFMLANVVIRNEDRKRFREAEERVKLMFDTTPLACRLWDKDLNIIECNQAAVKLFGLRDKGEFKDRFFELLPKFQSDGRDSAQVIRNSLMEAFETGECIYQIEFRLPDGTVMPAENSLYRVRYGETYVVAGYTRDLREQKKMIAKIERTTEQLAIALADAEQANKAKSNFLAHMSHEIRTPLNAVVGFTELALREEGLDDEQMEKLKKVHSASGTILSIVNDILDISKIESGKLELYPTQYDTPSLINDIVTLNIMRLGEKPIFFDLDIDPNLPVRLYGDELRLKQIFNNLLSNAFKYTSEGAVTLGVSFTREGTSIWLHASVTDTGIGMKPESIQKLFDDYNQVAERAHRLIEGTGLGLPIAKRLVEMMDGTITVESEYGKGSTFHVRLRQGFVDDTPIGKEVAKNLTSHRYALVRSGVNMNLNYLNLSYAHLLVVDDIVTNLEVVKGMMKPYGLRMDSALNGPQAIEMIRSGEPRYSAVFMDQMMPGMDGIEAARIIREEIGTEYARSLPIIALTANAIVGSDKMFLECGFQDFLSKPIDTAKLDRVLRRWVRDKEREQELIHANGTLYHTSPTETDAADITTLLEKAAIAGMDMKKMIPRFHGDTASILNVLRSYAKNIPPLVDALEGFLAGGLIKNYAIAVHGIKGPSYSISADAVGEVAEALEMAARAEEVGTIKRLHQGFVQSTKALAHEISRTLAQLDAANQRQMGSEPDPALLKELQEACVAADLDRVDKLMEQLELVRYERGERLVAWLRERVDEMEYDLIAGGNWPAE